MDGDHLPTGARCLEGKNGQKPRPACVVNALGEMMVLDHVGRLQILIIDRVIDADQSQRRLVVKILALAAHLLMCLC